MITGRSTVIVLTDFLQLANALSIPQPSDVIFIKYYKVNNYIVFEV